MWTSESRARYDRGKLRYPSDLTDAEWQLVKLLIPPGKPGGGKRTVIMREVVNGLMYVLSTGCQWRAVPKDLPPKSTIYDYFDLWTYDGTLQRIHHALYEQCREQSEREVGPSAAIIDSQSVKSAEKALGIGRTRQGHRIGGLPHFAGFHVHVPVAAAIMAIRNLAPDRRRARRRLLPSAAARAAGARSDAHRRDQPANVRASIRGRIRSR